MRADVAISPHARRRKAALPTPSEPVRLLHEKAAGRSCRRRARPDLHIATGAAAFARDSLGPGVHAQRRARHPSTDLPAATPPRPKAWPVSPGPHMTQTEAGATPQPPWTGRQALMRRTWPSASMTTATAMSLATPEATDAGRPALGRAAATRELALPHSCLQAGPGRKRGPTLSRTGESQSRVLGRDNRAPVPDSKNPVSNLPSRAQKRPCLSTESPTGPASR